MIHKYMHDTQVNKLSLVGMQLPEKYKENFEVSGEGPSSGLTPYLQTKGLHSKRRNSPDPRDRELTGAGPWINAYLM